MTDDAETSPPQRDGGADRLSTALERFHAGDLEVAEALCLQLEQQAPSAALFHLQGLIGQQRGQHEYAALRLARAMTDKPLVADYHHALGVSLRALGQLEDAAACFYTAAQLAPSNAVILSSLGNTLRALGQLEDAIAAHRLSIELRPDLAEGWSNLALAYRESGQLNMAIEAFRCAAELNPGVAALHHNLGSTLLFAGRLEEAGASLRRALALIPGHVGALIDLGTTLQALRQDEEAIELLRQAIQVQPHNADAHWNLALALLATGQSEEGWREYEWRREIPSLQIRRMDQPGWDGGPLNGRTLLLHAEQGLGDTLQFLRFARAARAAGGRILVECQPPLLRLLQRCDGIDHLVARGVPLPRFELQMPLMSLPATLGAPLETIDDSPWLHAEPELERAWRTRLDPGARLHVGVCWQGNPKYRADRERSIPLRYFEALARVPGVRLYALQKGAGREQLGEWPTEVPIIDVGRELDETTGAFVDTAAFIRSLDLVVTSDTALPHLAGGLGVEVWLLLCHLPDWRWGRKGDRSPWYPSMRLFRQHEPGDWLEVFERVSRELAAHQGSTSASG